MRSAFPLETLFRVLVLEMFTVLDTSMLVKCVCSPWHFANRSGPQLRGGWDQRLGAVSMPTVVAKLHEIGKYIAAQSSD